MNTEDQQKAVYKDEKTQQALNTPLSDGSTNDPKDQEFLNHVLALIEDGKIDLYKPETLVNRSVYDVLTEEARGKVDLEAVNLLSALREIKGLNDAGFAETYQMKNLVKRVRNTKERLEDEGGDLFII